MQWLGDICYNCYLFAMLMFALFLYAFPLLDLADSWVFPFNLAEKLFSFFRPKSPTTTTTTTEFPDIESPEATEKCIFYLNGDIPATPLILTTDGMPEIVYPSDEKLKLSSGDQIRLTCLDSRFNKTFNGMAAKDILVTCIRDNIVRVEDEHIPLKDLKCIEFPKSVIKRRENKTCYKNHTLIDIGYQLDDSFLKILTSCFDETSQNAIYTWYDSSMLHEGRQLNVPRRHFTEKGIYNFSIDMAYNFHHQRHFLANILGSVDIAKQYIVNDYLHYLSRGHLTPKADFVYGVEQAATFHFINAAPQWQTFNAGNWERLENGVRELLIAHEDRYRVVTGTYDVATLPNVNNQETKLYLHIDQNNNYSLQVPKFFWKIVYDYDKGTGVVIIGINNVYLESIPPEYILCKGHCDRIRWLPRFKNDISKGYIYCCNDIDEFLNKTGFDSETFL